MSDADLGRRAEELEKAAKSLRERAAKVDSEKQSVRQVLEKQVKKLNEIAQRSG